MRKYLVFSVVFLFIYAFLAPAHSDETDDKRKLRSVITFYFKQTVNGYVDNFNDNRLSLFNELYFDVTLNKDFYFFTGKTSDTFVTDFSPLFFFDNTLNVADLFLNSFSVGLQNKFRAKNKIKSYLNLDFSVHTPFGDNPSITVNPYFQLEGDYYTGFYWLIDNGFPINIVPATSYTKINSTLLIRFGYEFFRFYGPNNFKFSLISENLSDISIYTQNPKNILNQYKQGIKFQIYYLSLISYFTSEIKYFFEYNFLNYSLIGSDSSIEVEYKFLHFVFSHTFVYDLNSTNYFSNSFSLSFKFQLVR